MTKAEDRESIKQAMKNYKKPIRLLTEEDEIEHQAEQWAEQSQRDGETRSISTYHYQDGSVGHRQY